MHKSLEKSSSALYINYERHLLSLAFLIKSCKLKGEAWIKGKIPIEKDKKKQIWFIVFVFKLGQKEEKKRQAEKKKQVKIKIKIKKEREIVKVEIIGLEKRIRDGIAYSSKAYVFKIIAT